MEGHNADVPEQFRDYQLAKTFGYTPAEIDAAPATRLDWMLACHSTVVQAENAQAERTSR